MVTETEENIARLEGIIKEFDKPDRIETRRYPLKYASAAETAEIVREISDGPEGGSQARGSAPIRERNPGKESMIPTAKQPRTGGSASPVESFRQYRQPPSQVTGAGQPEGTAQGSTTGGQTSPCCSRVRRGIHRRRVGSGTFGHGRHGRPDQYSHHYAYVGNPESAGEGDPGARRSR